MYHALDAGQLGAGGSIIRSNAEDRMTRRCELALRARARRVVHLLMTVPGGAGTPKHLGKMVGGDGSPLAT